MVDRRAFEILYCDYCLKSPVWTVYEDYEDDEVSMMVCEDHKFTAYS